MRWIDSRTRPSIEPATSSPLTAINPPLAVACRASEGAVERLRDYRTPASTGGRLCYLSFVTRIVPASIAVLVLFGCGAQPEGVDRQAEWRNVLERKKAAVSAEAS